MIVNGAQQSSTQNCRHPGRRRGSRNVDWRAIHGVLHLPRLWIPGRAENDAMSTESVESSAESYSGKIPACLIVLSQLSYSLS